MTSKTREYLIPVWQVDPARKLLDSYPTSRMIGISDVSHCETNMILFVKIEVFVEGTNIEYIRRALDMISSDISEL
jgi:hypothetical protein